MNNENDCKIFADLNKNMGNGFKAIETNGIKFKIPTYASYRNDRLTEKEVMQMNITANGAKNSCSAGDLIWFDSSKEFKKRKNNFLTARLKLEDAQTSNLNLDDFRKMAYSDISDEKRRNIFLNIFDDISKIDNRKVAITEIMKNQAVINYFKMSENISDAYYFVKEGIAGCSSPIQQYQAQQNSDNSAANIKTLTQGLNALTNQLNNMNNQMQRRNNSYQGFDASKGLNFKGYGY